MATTFVLFRRKRAKEANNENCFVGCSLSPHRAQYGAPCSHLRCFFRTEPCRGARILNSRFACASSRLVGQVHRHPKSKSLITDKVEQQVNGIEEVDEIWSTSVQGLSTVFVEINDDLSPQEIPNVWDKVRARVRLAPMPDPSIHPIVNDEFGDTSVLLLAVHQIPVHGRSEIRDSADMTGKTDRYTLRQLEIFADEVQDELRLLPGVAKAEKYGVVNEAVYIETDVANWSQIELTTQSLKRLADERNIIEPGRTDRHKFWTLFRDAGR